MHFNNREVNMVWLFLLLACAPDVGPGDGPTFGGDPRTSSPAGWLAHAPLAVDDDECAAPVCLRTAAAWRPDDGLLIALGVEGALTRDEIGRIDRPPADLVLVLDASGSVDEALDVRDAAAEITLDHLRADDTIAVVGFRAAPGLLLPPTRGMSGREWAMQALDALDAISDMQQFMQAFAPDCCDEGSLWDAVDGFHACVEVEPPCAAWADASPEARTAFADTAADLEAWLDSDNLSLSDGLLAIACADGTDVPAALELAFSAAPTGTEARASRVVLVSDADGAAAAVPATRAAAMRWVGLTTLGITSAMDPDAAVALAHVPGGLFVSAVDPAEALATWDASFDRLVAPRLWGLSVEVAEQSEGDWTLVDLFGATHAAGVATVFASTDHAALGVTLRSTGDPRLTPFITVSAHGPGWSDTTRLAARLPLNALDTPVGRGEELAALRLAARIDLYEHSRRPSQALLDRVGDSLSVLDDPVLDDLYLRVGGTPGAD
ncbi:MAG: hypothetical protein ACI8PZ_000165 [Myxococcota bacterium]|jgi:hypothetical protein